MLDTETKRRIDTARNILVGKIPDPKSQVEQITLALIYKFMDDMDAYSVENHGKASFFVGEYEKYGWRKIFDPRLGGHEMLGLYGDALQKLNQNPNLPELFRNIFKNAYLPYRDPETLKLFLKTIDEFRYDHSERLGDAFEYLLSVLGSQGDAGQFRTPRHIIDFIVDIVDPQKGETILDPACGTAGFLISAYKHIVENNPNLSPEDRKRLMKNVVGYDISPDMVRLSLANMYLHDFPTPEIHEYDTLTSEERWNEYYDVILANPPFMSPKGGIQPHKRFAINAKRSEVLFVDYIAEHLTPNGRAGIIVPEGIIFQSQTAYKALRKMLVEQYLVAVVSLPAGVFNPYSGVKTSILILDKSLAKQSDTVGFFKVENDGFGLGAQRRPIDKNDLPQVLADINEYLRNLRSQLPTDDWQPPTGQIVAKEKIAANGDYNLSGERYRDGGAHSMSWPMVPLGSVIDIESGSRQKGGAIESGIPSIGGEQIDEDGKIRFDKMKYVSEEHFRQMRKGILERGDVLVVKDGATTGKTAYFSHDIKAAVNEHVFILRARDAIESYFLYRLVRAPVFQERLQPFIKGIIGGISLEIREMEIPLPPLDVQKEIVAEIEGYQKVIDGARAVLDNYRPHIPINPEWPMVEIGKVSDVTSSKRILAEEYVPAGTPFFRTKEIVELSKGYDITVELFISRERFESIKARFGAPAKGELLISAVGTIGVSWVVADNREFYFKDGNLLWIKNLSNLDPDFLKHCLDATFARGIDHVVFGAAYKALTIEKLKEFTIPLPPLAEQSEIVAEIEAEQRLVEANRELIARMEAKIAATLARIWGSEEKDDSAASSATV